MLKPAHEPICLAYKPAGKRELGVDECRIAITAEDFAATQRTGDYGETSCGVVGFTNTKMRAEVKPTGRWPANIIHDGSDEVMEAFAVYGDTKGGGDIHRRSSPKTSGIYGSFSGEDDRWMGYADNGSAARFFYSAKADKQDRWGSKHPTVKPVELIKYLVKLVCPPGGTFLDPFAGSGTAAVAALAEGRNAILIERDPGYCADIRERIAFYEGNGRHSLVTKNRARIQPLGSLL